MIDREAIWEELKDELAKAKCGRRTIGALALDKYGHVLGRGYNGPIAGKCTCPGRDVPAGTGAGKVVECYSVHAEIRAIMAVDEPELIDTVVCSKAPCTACVLILLGTRCKTIYYVTPSNETQNKELWLAAGRAWEQW